MSASDAADRPETAQRDFPTALDEIRAGVDSRSEINARISDLLEVAADLDCAREPYGHPKVTQSIFRYEHDAETVRGEFERALETYDLDGEPGDIEAVVVETAARIADPAQEESNADASASGHDRQA